ncbi:cadherin-like domain-containing protein [Patescibacteria group bacterium]|nr:cadherin-like domain-containing protein [Patescibacteria group bacterium]
MKNLYSAAQKSGRFLLVLAVAVSLVLPVSTPALADTVLSDGFGTGNNANDISGWNEEGDDNDSSTLARQGQNSGEDVKSPNDGRFAKIADGEWICRQVNTSGLTNLTLKYYWNGDSDAENNQDYGVVEYRATANGTSDQVCNSNANSWDELASHELHSDTNWSPLQTINLPDELDNDSSWFIRFRTDASSSDEYFRVDGVLIEGSIPDTTDPTVTVNQKNTQIDPTASSPIEFTAVFSEPVVGFDEADVLVSGSAFDLPVNATVQVTGGPTTYTIKVSGMDNSNNDTVVVSIPAGGAQDASGNPNDASTSLDNVVTYNVNEAPVAFDKDVDTNEDQDVAFVLNATDSESDPLTWEIVDGPDHGDLEGTAPNLTYDPDFNFYGSDQFTFRVNDGSLDSNVATVDIDVAPVSETCDQGYELNNQDQCVPVVMVDICHYTESETNPTEIISINQNALSAHEAHGDFLIEDEADEEACIGDGEPEPAGQCTLVSDTQTLIGGNPSVLTFEHTAWADALDASGAQWIWDSYYVAAPGSDQTVVFTRSFSLDAIPTNADLEFAADNGVAIEVNGTQVVDQLTLLDGDDQNYNDPVDSVDITSELQTGTNTIEFTVKNLAYATQDPEVNPAGLLYRLSIEGSACGVVDETIENSCIVPSEEGSIVMIGTSPLAEDTLQQILDAEYAGDAPNAANDQDNFESWSGTGNTVHFSVKNISEDDNSGHTHVFGYFLNGGSFTPLFREGLVGAPYAAATELVYGADMNFSVANVNTLVFAMADWDGVSYDYYATDNALNAGGEAHALVYNVTDDTYAIAFEDLLYL